MIDRKHNVIVDIDGEQVGFRFSTWAIQQTIKANGLKGLLEFYNRFGAGDIEIVASLTQEARKEFLFYEKIEKEITLRDAYELIDSIGGILSAVSVFSEGIKGHSSKNQTPPQEVGEMTEPILQ